jgi:3-phosphoshikimate 1-carboxyvinyltransferase
MTEAVTWPAPVAGSPVDATVRVPGSKSLTNRWLVLAALADTPCSLQHPLRSRDTEHMADALRTLGIRVDSDSDAAWQVRPAPRGPDGRPALTGGVTVDCGQAGTVMRFVPPLATLADGPVRFEGHASALSRPVGPVLQALRDLGVRVDDDGRGTLPFTVHGRPGSSDARPTVRIDASGSSQFLSALLLAGAALPHGVAVEHSGGRLPSLPHITMTLDVLARVGIDVDQPSPTRWVVHPGRVSGFQVTVEPDLSSAAPFLALAAATGGTVRVLDWPAVTTQPGARMREVLTAFGARTELTDGALVARGADGGSLSGVDLDLGEVGELTPVVAALATLAQGPSRLRGVAHLRSHETDRLAAIVREVRRLGAGAEETDDGLVIRPGPLHPATLATYHDHRMAMFAAVVGSRVPGTQVEDVDTAAKTFPGFHGVWEAAVSTAEGSARGGTAVVPSVSGAGT